MLIIQTLQNFHDKIANYKLKSLQKHAIYYQGKILFNLTLHDVVLSATNPQHIEWSNSRIYNFSTALHHVHGVIDLPYV